MDVCVVRVVKKDGNSFIKILVDSEKYPIGHIKDEKWLEHNGRKYQFGFTISEELFKKLRNAKIEEIKIGKKEEIEISKEFISKLVKHEGFKEELRKMLSELIAQEKEKDDSSNEIFV